MDMTGERRIAAPRETVWQALNDPTVLKASIPGCELLEKLSDTDMKASASVKIGPIAARFNGAVHLSDIAPQTAIPSEVRAKAALPVLPRAARKCGLEPAGEATLLQL